MEFTCIKCEFKFHETNMDTDERMCYDCLDEDETEPTREPVGSQPYPEWDCEKGCYILPMKRRIEVEITYEGEEE